MTKADRRCGWCGAAFRWSGAGRPPSYCRRSHRQRAYEARRLAGERGLADDEVLVGADTWQAIRDSLYLLETAAQDAAADMADAHETAELEAIVTELVRAVERAAGLSLEPRATGSA